MKTNVILLFPATLNHYKSAMFGVKCYQAVSIAQEVQTLCERATKLRYTYMTYHVCYSR
jgi:hypothetical protein